LEGTDRLEGYLVIAELRIMHETLTLSQLAAELSVATLINAAMDVIQTG